MQFSRLSHYFVPFLFNLFFPDVTKSLLQMTVMLLLVYGRRSVWCTLAKISNGNNALFLTHKVHYESTNCAIWSAVRALHELLMAKGPYGWLCVICITDLLNPQSYHKIALGAIYKNIHHIYLYIFILLCFLKDLFCKKAILLYSIISRF